MPDNSQPTIKKWRTFTITITGQAGDYVIAADDSRNIRVPSQPFSWNPTPKQHEVVAELHGDGKVETEDVAELGKALYEAVFESPSGMKTAFSRAQGDCRKNDEGLRLALRIEPHELSSLPWEAMRDSGGLISARPETPLVRTFSANELHRMDVKGALCMLFMSATPPHQAAVNVDQTLDRLRGDVLKDSRAGKRLEIKVEKQVDAKSLVDHLEKRTDHVVLFAGHGKPGEISLQDGTPIFPVEFASALGYDPGVDGANNKDIPTRLVFLMACNTGASFSETDGALAGFAEELARDGGIPAVVVMQTKIGDDNADEFARRFFGAIARFEPVDVAMAKARQSIQEVGRDAIAPVMYLQARDAQLFRKPLNLTNLLVLLLIILAAALAVVITMAARQGPTVEQAKLTAQAEQTRAATAKTQEAIAAIALDQQMLVNQTVEAEAQVAREGERQASEKEVRERQAADIERRRARASELAATARNVFANQPGDPSLALLLAIEAAKVTWPQDRYIPPDVASTLVDLAAAGPTLLNTFPQHYHRGKINSIEFSPDGSLLVSASDDQTARIWDMATSEQVASLVGHTDRVTDAEFSPDGTYVATSSVDGTVRIWSTLSGEQLHLLEGEGASITAITFEMDGSSLYASGEENLIMYWDTTSWEKRTHRFEHGVYEVEMLAPNQIIVFGDNAVWDTKMWKKLWSFQSIGYPRPRAVSKQNQLIGIIGRESRSEREGTGSVSYDVPIAVVIDGITEEQVFYLPGERSELWRGMSLSSDGRFIAITTQDGVRVWDVKTGTEQYVIEELNLDIVAFSPDGRYLVITDNLTLRVHDALDGSLISEVGRFSINPFVQYSPNGLRIAASSGDHFRIWDIAANSTLMQAPGWLLPNAFDPTGDRVVGRTPNGDTQIWNVNTGQVILQLPEQNLSTYLFSRDGDILFTANQGGTIRAWDYAQGIELGIIGHHAGGIKVMALGVNQHRLVTGGDDGAIRVWDIDKRGQIMEFDEHRGNIEFIIVGYDDQTVTSTDANGTVYVWDIESGRVLNTWSSQDGKILQLRSVRNGSLLLDLAPHGDATVWQISRDNEEILFRRVISDTEFPTTYLSEQYLAVEDPRGTVKVWDVFSGEELASIMLYSSYSIAISPDQCCLIAGSTLGTASIWSLQPQFGDRPKMLREDGTRITDVDFSPDGEKIIAATENDSILVLDRFTGRVLYRMENPGRLLFSISSDFADDLDARLARDNLIQILNDNGQEVTSIVQVNVVSDGQRWVLSSGGRDYLVKREGEVLSVYRPRAIKSVAYSPDGSLIATLDQDSILSLWDIQSGQRLSSVRLNQSEIDISEYDVVFSSDGQKVAAGTDQSPSGIQMLDVPTGVLDRTYYSGDLIAFSPLGQIAAITRVSDIGKVDLTTGSISLWLQGHTGRVTSIQFSPTGRHILTASTDGTARLWDAAYAQILREFQGATSWNGAADFDPSGNFILTAGDRTVRIWDVASGRELLRYEYLEGYTGYVSHAEFSPDGRWLLIVRDGRIDLQPATPMALLSTAESLIQRDPPMLSAAERKQYALD